MKICLLFSLAFIVFNPFHSFSQSTNSKGDFDFYVIVLDKSKNPLSNLEVKIKNEDEELMNKKNTGADGSIEFRGLFKNKSYHVEFYNNDERIKNADKIYLKDQFKTEEITKAETGFDYFIFVGDNLSFSELGTRDAREDTAEEIAAKQTNTNNQVAAALKEEKQEATQEKTPEPIKQDDTPIAATPKEEKQEATQETTANSNKTIEIKNEETSTNVTTSNKIEDTNATKNTQTSEVVSNKVSSNEPKKQEEPVKEEKAPVVITNEEKKSEPIAVNTTKEETPEPPKQELKSSISENSIANKTTTVDFALFKDKDFNSPETHALLIKEEEKISSKKIKYKVQVGAYTNQVVANQVKIYGFGEIEKQNYPDGFTRITLGNCKSLKEAEELRKKIITKGLNGAWIVAFLDGKRYTMKELVANNFFQ
jgi:hypothetical protein